jgi:hypothetical protein
VDVDLLERTGSKKTESGFPDYSGFYDLDLLSQVMNEHYGAQPPRAIAPISAAPVSTFVTGV